jgi:hypothetical protein
MTAWLNALSPKYASRFIFLVDWCDTPPSEARRIVEQEIADDIAFERRAA